MPNRSGPIRASPESLSRILLYRGASATALPSPRARALQSRLRAHLGCEVVLALLQPLADLEAREAANLAVLADLRHQLGQERPDVLLVIFHEGLIEQHDLLFPLCDLALDHLGDDVVRLAGLPGLLGADGPLLLDH